MEPQLVRGLGEQIVERLREDIFSGRIAEGERLREVDLAERFAVSRGPIRDALRQLSWEGIVQTDRNRGAQVAASAPNEIQELIIPLRRTIEGYAVRLFFEELTAADFERWETILEVMKKACKERDFATASEQDIAFHRFLVERSKSPDLLAIWSVIVARVRRHFRESHMRYDDPMDIYREHTPLVEAFKSGDEKLAIKLLEDHIR
ncbi:MAG: GntR family transcriptional regulator [Planctomycetaceae bacterium]|nr:GntR family transcriptional regulator [Planctomycetaceae bacterium]